MNYFHPTVRIRKVPLNWCEEHRLVGIWEDHAGRWRCPSCIEDAFAIAEDRLRLDRAVHAGNHVGSRTEPTCRYCTGAAE